MLVDIEEVEILDGYNLKLRFADGIEGVLDISKIVDFKGVFKPLRDIDYFRKVALYQEGGTIFWPNGADIDPDVLYSLVSGKPLPEFATISSETKTD
jgi:Protein of unknown function (DUF2442)